MDILLRAATYEDYGASRVLIEKLPMKGDKSGYRGIWHFVGMMVL